VIYLPLPSPSEVRKGGKKDNAHGEREGEREREREREREKRVRFDVQKRGR